MKEKDRLLIGLFVRVVVLCICLIFASLFSSVIYKTFFQKTEIPKEAIEEKDDDKGAIKNHQSLVHEISLSLNEIKDKISKLEVNNDIREKEVIQYNDNLIKHHQEMLKTIKNVLEEIKKNNEMINKIATDKTHNSEIKVVCPTIESTNKPNIVNCKNIDYKELEKTRKQCSVVQDQNNEILTMIKVVKDKILKYDIEKNVKLKNHLEYGETGIN